MKAQSEVIILDSHQLFSVGLQVTLAALGAEFKSGVVGSLEEAITKLIRNKKVTLAFVGLAAKGVVGPATIRTLRARFPKLRIIAVCADPQRDIIFECLAQGAHGCILKTQCETEILNAVRIVMSNGVYVPASILESVDCSSQFDALRKAERAGPVDYQTSTPRGEIIQGHVHLSNRQQAVLKLLVTGLSNSAIAREMQLAESTVKVHVTAVFKALKVNNRVQAVLRSRDFEKPDQSAKLGVDAYRQTGSGPDPKITIN